MVRLRKNKVRIWILALVVGAASGFLLAMRLNLLPHTSAEYETAKPAATVEQSLESSFVRVAREAGAAVVSISTEHTQKLGQGRQFRFFGDDEFERFFDQFFRDFFGEIPEREYKQKGLGSGFIIDEEGYILTNQHVVQDAEKITVTLPDGRSFKAELKGSDVRSDLAVIKIKAHNLPVLKLGNSDEVEIGQWAIAVGNPYGFAVGSAEPTVTAGIISALNRSLPQSSYQRRSYTDLIQTDAAINPGNSGGPLVNLKGEAIGINVAIFTPSGGNVGIGFAIPVNTARDVLTRLIAGKKILYGWLGISVQDLDEELAAYFGIADQQGALVVKVLEASPAEDAGFKEGDVIRKFAGQPVKDVRGLLREVGKAGVGKAASVEIIRQKRALTLKVKVGERPESLKELTRQTEAAWRGIEVSEITSDLARRYRIREGEGVLITHVEPESAASEGGLAPGDVIIAINRQRIKNMRDYESVIKQVQGDALIRTGRGFVVLKGKRK
ncbi:MAG: Do family serine endopeptidase [Candidatus Omnitrophica bacterium]|nr:Do family serine endopeptidase [Candidatus Omnitrophota bacterium]MBU4141062.1 Do family serine endopeptidase [Candidatus Omnitrophota bacterium]